MTLSVKFSFNLSSEDFIQHAISKDCGAAELYWFYRNIYKTDFAVYINAINAAEMFLWHTALSVNGT